MFNPQKCDRITTISISLSMVKSLQPGVRLAPACPCRCSARRDWDGTAGLSGNLPIVKNGLGGKEKTSLHIICVLKKSLVLFQQMHWRGTQSCWYNWYDIYIYIIYNMYMYVWLCMYMQIKGRVAVMRRQQKIESQRTSTVLGDWRGSAGKVDVPHPHHALWACDLQWRFSQDQNTT